MEEPHIVEQMLFRKTTSAGKISADREPDLMIPAMPRGPGERLDLARLAVDEPEHPELLELHYQFKEQLGWP